MAKTLHENANYIVTTTNDAIGEDGKYGRTGYAVTNKTTGVAEYSSLVLPESIYRADFYNKLLDIPVSIEVALESEVEDVTFPRSVN